MDDNEAFVRLDMILTDRGLTADEVRHELMNAICSILIESGFLRTADRVCDAQELWDPEAFLDPGE